MASAIQGIQGIACPGLGRSLMVSPAAAAAVVAAAVAAAVAVASPDVGRDKKL